MTDLEPVDTTPSQKPKWPGPVARVEWIFNDETRVAAKQAEMLMIDLRAFSRWAESMEALIAERLPDKDFTERRMEALRAWEKERKRAQRNLHYKYDPRRRDPELIERDIRATRNKLAQARVQLDAYTARRQAKASAMPDEVEPTPSKPRRARVERPLVRRDLPGLPDLPFLRSLAGIDESVLEAVMEAAGVDDLTTITDDELRVAIVERGSESAQIYIDALNASQS